jgi:DNA-binding SARP family transcriptional activator
MLGGFSISYGGREIADVRSHTRKAWMFLEYLIANRDRTIAQEEIAKMLWPGEDSDDTVNTLKTLLYRTRALLDTLELGSTKQLVRYRRGTYAWTPAISCVVDVEEFRRMCKQAGEPGVSEESKTEFLMGAFELYDGKFLPNHAHEPWVASLNERLHSLYTESMYELTDILREQGRTSDIIAVCNKAVALDPYDERMHIRLTQALAATGDTNSAISHYDYVTTLFFNGLGVTPSKELTSVYSELIKTTRVREMSLSAIKDDLREVGENEGCLYVEYEFFKSLYRLEARNEARSGQIVYLALMTVTDDDGLQPALKVLRKAMSKLSDTISQSLRRGDVFTRFSVSQYLIMLPSAVLEDGEIVIKRIIKQFKRENPRVVVQIAYSLQPVTPTDLEE